MRRILRGTMVICALALVSAVSACTTGGGGASPGASPPKMSDAEILAIGKQVADCVRANGIPDFPDPLVDKGRLKLPENAEQEIGSRYSEQVLEGAMQACQPIMDRLPESAIKSDSQSDTSEQDAPQDVETMKKLAQCLRDNGLPEWPDPRPDGSFPLAGTPLEAEGKSDRLLAAGEKCKEYWTGSIRYS